MVLLWGDHASDRIDRRGPSTHILESPPLSFPLVFPINRLGFWVPPSFPWSGTPGNPRIRVDALGSVLSNRNLTRLMSIQFPITKLKLLRAIIVLFLETVIMRTGCRWKYCAMKLKKIFVGTSVLFNRSSLLRAMKFWSTDLFYSTKI